MKALRTQNYYEILSVAPTASAEEIRKAYELSKVTFQENSLATYSLFTEEENQEILGLISRAYETLFNPSLRREYDDFLEGLDQENNSLPGPSGAFQPSQPNPMEGAGLTQAQSHPPLPRETVRIASLETGRPANAPERGAAVHPAGPATPPPAPPQNEEAVVKFLDSVTEINGEALKKIRQLRGLSLEDVAENTKIRKTYIQYMEEENFDHLPAEIYVKGFAAIIARLLGVPTTRLTDDYIMVYRRKK